MANHPISDPEILWDQLLSRQPQHIQAAYQTLLPQEQNAVINHLKRMTSDPDWHPEQRISAQIALDTLKDVFD